MVSATSRMAPKSSSTWVSVAGSSMGGSVRTRKKIVRSSSPMISSSPPSDSRMAAMISSPRRTSWMQRSGGQSKSTCHMRSTTTPDSSRLASLRIRSAAPTSWSALTIGDSSSGWRANRSRHRRSMRCTSSATGPRAGTARRWPGWHRGRRRARPGRSRSWRRRSPASVASCSAAMARFTASSAISSLRLASLWAWRGTRLLDGLLLGVTGGLLGEGGLVGRGGQVGVELLDALVERVGPHLGGRRRLGLGEAPDPESYSGHGEEDHEGKHGAPR